MIGNEMIDVFIPVYKPDKDLKKLINRLKKQTIYLNKIWIIQTGKGGWQEEWFQGMDRIQVVYVEKEDFDHGGTRRMGSNLSHSEYFVWMTQDAIPKDSYLIEELLQPFIDEKVAVSYARQLPKANCGFLERYIRRFNYPQESKVKTKEDEPFMGIQTFFSSDVCAMYRRSNYDKIGGFVKRTIFNEDMLFAINAIRNNMAVAYCANAMVYHSHNYTLWSQFQRNFDLGVSQQEYAEYFIGIHSESRGIQMIKKVAQYAIYHKKVYLIGQLILESAVKLFGYRLGKYYQKLPHWLILKCTMNRSYWARNNLD